MMKNVTKIIIIAGLMALMSACVPQTENRYQVAVINAPTENRIIGLAEQLEKSLIRNGYSGFTDSGRVRFIERNREMHGYRAILASAQVARTVGAEYAVYVGAPIYERAVEEIVPNGSFIKVLHISSRLQLEAVIVDPRNGEVVASFSSNKYFAERIVPIDAKVPAKDADPDIQSMINAALNEIAPAIANNLSALRDNFGNYDADTSDYLPSR